MPSSTSRRLLQAAVAILSLVPIVAGGSVVFGGAGVLLDGTAPSADLDSHARYLSGLLLGLGLLFFASVPTIERRTALFRIGASVIVTGGLARLLSLLSVGPPSAVNLAALAIELGAVPLLALWQGRVARGS